MTSPNPDNTPAEHMEDAATATVQALRRAQKLVETFAPQGPDRVDVLRRLGLMIAGLAATTQCRTCRSEFALSASEASYFRSKGLTLPTHCARCRVWRRHEKAQREPTRE